MRLHFLLAILLITISLQVKAQETWRCATTEMNRIALENNPDAVARQAELQRFIADYISHNYKDDQVYVIPVVFHVVHYYGPENISKEQIEDEIRILNLDYRLQNSDTTYIIPPFKQLATDSHIEFRLAKLDPNGNCTDGITRTYSYETYDGGEQIKDIAPSWPRAEYLNIWVVARIPGGVAGYAYYPGSVGDGQDGILIDHSYVGSIGTSSVSHGRVLTHEIGHYLGLPHPWGNSNEPGLPENCEIDDGIEDTPNTIGHTDCSLYAVTCGSLDNVQNYMEYSYCCLMFTHGQGQHMRAVLNSSVSQRNNLWSYANLIGTGVYDETAIALCQPVADYDQDIKVSCTGTDIQYYDLSYNTDSIYNWNWTFEGGTPNISDEKNPVVVYENPGNYGSELTVSNPGGSDTKTKDNAISVYTHDDAIPAPFFNGFEDVAFPDVTGFINNNFYFVNQGVSFWTRTTSASASGNYSLRIKNLNNDNNIANSFYTPLVEIDTNSFPITVNFKTAYAKASSTTNDILRVYCSYDCGKSWTIKYYNSGNGLKTTDNYYPNGTFIPNSTQWRVDSFVINRPAEIECQSVRLRFETLSKGGNCLYIDNIEMLATQVSSPSVNKNNSALAYPNPFENQLMISGLNAGEVILVVSDLTGRVIAERKTNYNENELDISDMFTNCTSGSYLLRIVNGNSDIVKIVNKK